MVGSGVCPGLGVREWLIGTYERSAGSSVLNDKGGQALGEGDVPRNAISKRLLVHTGKTLVICITILQ